MDSDVFHSITFYRFSFVIIQITCQNALITHAHICGVNGAILQAIAVYKALHIEPPSLEPYDFIDQLIEVAEKIEEKNVEKR